MKWPASIKIGPIRRSHLEEFLAVLSASGIMRPHKPFESESDLMAAASEREGVLIFSIPLAEYGRFEELEAFLFQNAIPFDRQSGAKEEFAAEVIVFRPEHREIWTFIGDQDTFRGYVPRDMIEKVLERMPSLSFADGMSEMREIIGPSFAPIQPFAILED